MALREAVNKEDFGPIWIAPVLRRNGEAVGRLHRDRLEPLFLCLAGRCKSDEKRRDRHSGKVVPTSCVDHYRPPSLSMRVRTGEAMKRSSCSLVASAQQPAMPVIGYIRSESFDDTAQRMIARFRTGTTRAPCRSVIHGHVATHHACELAGDGEAETGAAAALRGRKIAIRPDESASAARKMANPSSPVGPRAPNAFTASTVAPLPARSTARQSESVAPSDSRQPSEVVTSDTRTSARMLALIPSHTGCMP